MADRYAKEMASKILKGEIIAPRNISVNDCYNIASDIVHKSWQRYRQWRHLRGRGAVGVCGPPKDCEV